tara:strand:- start:36 stop:218 length:183 start_codon:yes stop_codon:yes gene_type:complete
MYQESKKYIIKMKGIIDQTIKRAIRKGKSIQVIRRYLIAKYKISVSLNVIKKRIKHRKQN